MDKPMIFVLAALEKIKVKDAINLTPATAISDLDFDSLDTLEMVMELEQLTQMQIEPGDFSDCITLKDLADKVARLHNERS